MNLFRPEFAHELHISPRTLTHSKVKPWATTQQKNAASLYLPTIPLQAGPGHGYRVEHKPQQEAVAFDVTRSEKRYQVPEGHEPVRLASTSGHVILVGEEPRHIPVGFVQEALVKGCLAVQALPQHTKPAENKPEPDKKKTVPATDISAKMSALKKDKIKDNSKSVDKFLATYLETTGHRPSDNNELLRHMRSNPKAYPLEGFSKDSDPKRYFYLKESRKTKKEDYEYYSKRQILRIIKARMKASETPPEKTT